MYRIIKKPRGWIVERKSYKWTLFGIKEVWEPFVKSSGLDCAWHHKSYDFAKMNLIDEILKNDVI